jgi:hypothetical protein
MFGESDVGAGNSLQVELHPKSSGFRMVNPAIYNSLRRRKLSKQEVSVIS